MAEQGLTRHDIEAKIVKRCWEDSAFQKEFTSDPAGAFVKHLGVPKASLPKIVVHEEPAGSWHIVLPAKPANAAELSDAELEQVAGGITPTILISVSISIATAVTGGASISAGVTVQKGW